MDVLTRLWMDVMALVTLSELHQKRHGHAQPLQGELEAALRRYRCVAKTPRPELLTPPMGFGDGRVRWAN